MPSPPAAQVRPALSSPAPGRQSRLPAARPGRPRSSPVLRKPRHTGALRPEHPRGRRARVTAGGPPGPCPSRGRGRGGAASQRGAASRRPFMRVAQRLPRVHASAHPRPAPPRGDGARAPAQGPWPRRSALSPPLGSSWRRVPSGHDSSTPPGGPAGAKRTRLWEGGLRVRDELWGPAGGSEARSAVRTAARSPHPERPSQQSWRGSPSFRGGEREQGLHSSGRVGVFSGRASEPRG